MEKKTFYLDNNNTFPKSITITYVAITHYTAFVKWKILLTCTITI